MVLLTDDEEFVAFCERELGEKPSERVLKIARAAYKAGMAMADIGYRNAMEGLDVITKQDIQRIIARIQDTDLQNEVANLLYESYMTGYNAYGVASVT